MNTLLTVDFDFFVPEKDGWDLGHAEAVFYLKMIWMIRAQLMSEMKLNGQEQSFWQVLPKSFTLPKCRDIFVSDSHLCAYNLAEDINQIILVDRHHDCFEWPTFKQMHTDSKYKVDCGNWAAVWLGMQPHRRLLWVYPDDLGDVSADVNFAVESGRKNRFEAQSYSEFCKTYKMPRKTDLTVHVCRSGCWVPPWLDLPFCDFVMASGLMPQVMQTGVWDPMVYRWNLDDYETAERVQADYGELKRKAHMLSGIALQVMR